MTTYSGQDGSVYIGSSLVAEISSWDLTFAANEVSVNVFGTSWSKTQQGIKNWSCSIEGFYDPSNSSGQKAILTAFINGSLISDIKLYIDRTYYYMPDTPNDANAGARIINFSPSQTADGVATISMQLAGNGAIALFPPSGLYFALPGNSEYFPLLF